MVPYGTSKSKEVGQKATKSAAIFKGAGDPLSRHYYLAGLPKLYLLIPASFSLITN